MLSYISYFFTMNLKKVQNYKRISAFLKECPNKLTFYPELKEDLKLLCSPEMKENIKSDLPQILPGILVLSTVTEESVVQEIVSLFGVISDIVSNNVSLKTEPWWREMENNIVPNKFFCGLTTLIERDSQFWAQIWIFAVSLMINDTQLQGSTVNSLLKIMEVAFKKSLSDTGSVMEKAFFCWIKFIEIFTSNPRISHSKKLIGLLIRPLTIPMGSKSHFKIIQTYKLIFEKVGNTEDKNIVTDIINSFIEYSYMKDGESFCKTHPNECCEILLGLICEKNSYRNMYILPVLSVFTRCVESRPLQDLLLKLWPSILDSSDIVNPNDYEQYLEEIIVQRQKILKNTELLKDYEAFREELTNHELPLMTPELLDKLLISNALSPKILADLLESNDFRTKTLTNYFNQFINNSEIERKETSCAAQMEAWDSFCAAFNLFVDSKGYQFQETDSNTFKPLILFPLQTHAKWTGITQRTWHSLIDLVEKIGILKLIIPDIISTLNLNMESNEVNTSTVIDIITHLVNIDKTVNFIPTVDKILAKLPVDDPKNAIDLLAFIENLIGHGDKKQYLSGVLSELLRICTCYDQLYEHRIRTKVSKLHRKLITDSKAEIGDKNKDSSKTPSPKIRSPLMAGSSFLHRLAKSEEKKATTSVSLGLGDRNMKNTLKSNKDIASNKCKDSSDKIISKDKEKEETMVIKEEITLPKTVNIVITNNTTNNVNNVPIIKTPEDNLKLNRKLQNGDCLLTSTTKKSANSKRTAISYFEDDSQEFVIVASKPKAKTPLTEHQKEKMLQRKTDIPALYQDLSQDTQSISSILVKNTPEIVVTSKDKKTLGSEGKNAENEDQANGSLDVIEVTPPAQDLLVTPTKSSPYMTASKKLNFDGLVKANSPAQGDKHTTLHETKNDLEENSISTPSRRVSHRKTTSKYGANRVITPTKDSDDINNENSATSNEGLNKKTFVKQERSGKKLKQEDDPTTEKKKELSLMNEKSDIDIKNVEDLKCNLENTLADSSSQIEDSLECNDKLKKKEKERSNAGKKSKLDVSNSRERSVMSEKNEKTVEKQDTIENSVKNEKLQEIKENNCNEKSIVKNSEEKKVDEKDFKPMQGDKLIKSALVTGIAQVKIQLHETSQGEPIKNTSATNVKISCDVEGGKDDKSELASSDKNAKHNNSDGSTTTPSQRTGRRPRKLPPTPFSPKLTRSKKLSLQGKDKSPKTPKDTKTKIRAPKPNTECFSSDSNDSLTGITPLEKNTGIVVEQVTVNNSLKFKVEEYSVKASNEEHLEKTVVMEGKINKESVSEEMKPRPPNPLEECNENSGPKKRGRKRKFQPSPETNDHSSPEIKIVNSSKKGKKRKTFGNNRVNSHSPRLSSGLEHWLFKKDKNLIQNVDVNKEFSVDKEDKSENKDLMASINSVSASPPVVNSTTIEKMSLEDNSPVDISHEEQLVENVKSENNRSDKIESANGDKQLMSIEECDTEIISTEELRTNDSQNLELVSNEIIASSQDVEYSDDIFGSMLKKVKLALPNEAKSISTQLNKVSSDITSKATPSDKSLEFSKANDVSPTVTKVEKIANGMKACDLIFKVAELEKKITIYMEEPPITANRDVEMNQEENESQDASAVSPEIPAEEVVASSQNEQRSLNNVALNKISSQNVAVSEISCERTENPQINSLMATSVEEVQMTNNSCDTFISAKSTENIKTVELHEKDIVVITSDEESPCKSNDKSCTMKDELITVEIKQSNGNDEVIVDTEIAESKNRGNVSPDKLKTEKLSETLNTESQNDSEHLFKSDTPKKRGARFIHTTEKEEDGGDTAEDRRRRNFRSKGTNLDDKNSPGSSGRSKHMVQLAQQGRHSRISTPRRRPSIVPITYGSNWPTGPTEEWVGVRPSTPGHCISPGILKSSPASSPVTSMVSPPPKKKRVNFLDPPVSTGLLYQKGTKIGIGQLQYAETSPSKKRLLNREEEGSEKKMKIISSEDEGKELEPAFEVEISSDESIEMLQIPDSEVSENNSLNEVTAGTVSQSSAEKSVDISENISESILENISEKSESIPDNTESIPDKSDFPILAAAEGVEISTEKPNENLEVDVNGEIYSKIPTEEELKIYANNQQFLNNLASCLNANGEPLSWLQRLLTLIVVGSKK